MNRVPPRLLDLIRIILPLGILAVGVAVFLVFGRRPEVLARPDTGDRGEPVRVAEAEAYHEPLVIELDGVAVPHRQVTLAAEVAGRIVRKSEQSRRGSFVEQGDFLLQVDPADYKLEVSRIQRELEQTDEQLRGVDVEIENAEALIALAEEDLQLQQRDLARRTKLYSTGATSESELDEARRRELAARNNLRGLQNQLQAARQRKQTMLASRNLVEVQLERARLDEARTEVVAPLAGTVTMDHVEQDDFVNRGDPLVLLSDPWPMEVKCSLRVDQLYWLWMESQLTSDAAPTASGKAMEKIFQIPQTDVTVQFEFDGVVYEWDGVLTRYEGSGLDADTRMVPCRVRVDEPTDVDVRARAGMGARVAIPSLFSGMYVSIRMPIDPPVPLLSIPTAALRPGDRVWVKRDGQLQIVNVEVALAAGDRVIIRQPPEGDLAPADKVVVSPLAFVRQGMSLREQTAP